MELYRPAVVPNDEPVRLARLDEGHEAHLIAATDQVLAPRERPAA